MDVIYVEGYMYFWKIYLEIKVLGVGVYLEVWF